MFALGVIANHGVESFRALIDSAAPHVEEIIVAVDSVCEDGIEGYMDEFVHYFRRPLAMNFSAQRNAIAEKVKAEWVLFLDTDENIGTWLWNNLHSVVDKSCDLVMLPRANYIAGQSKDESDFINWPDWQPKLHKRHIRWKRPVHEWPIGHNKTQWFPEKLEFAILHRKTIYDQEKANQLYARILDRPLSN